MELSFEQPWDRLPAQGATTASGVNAVEQVPGGTLTADSARASSHLVSDSGYRLIVTALRTTSDARLLAHQLALLVLERLRSTPPQLTVPADSLATKDICALVVASGAPAALGFSGTLVAAVDGRECRFGDRLQVAFVTVSPTTSWAGWTPVAIGPVVAHQVGTCELSIPIKAAPPGVDWAYEALFAVGSGGGTSCTETIQALTPLVTQLVAGG